MARLMPKRSMNAKAPALCGGMIRETIGVQLDCITTDISGVKSCGVRGTQQPGAIIRRLALAPGP